MTELSIVAVALIAGFPGIITAVIAWKTFMKTQQTHELVNGVSTELRAAETGKAKAEGFTEGEDAERGEDDTVSLYQPTHEQQTRAGNSAVTRRSGCTWTSGATGADAASGGHKDRTPDYVHGLVRNAEETNPATPGWSLPDLALAMKRLNVGFEVRSGRGWGKVVEAHNAGLYVVLQGDSDQFGNHTCSGSFDGDHAIGIRPGTYSGRWAIDDPICPDMRTETPAVLRRYAEKLWSTVFFGVFSTPVPQIPRPKPGWVATVHGRTDLYDGHGNVVGAVTKATYRTAERVKIDGAWRFRIVRAESGRPTKNAGKYLPAARTVTYRRP